MPHCEVCKDNTKPDELRTRFPDGAVICINCVGIDPVPDAEVDFDWGVSVSRNKGIQAGVRLGPATLRFEIGPEAFTDGETGQVK